LFKKLTALNAQGRECSYFKNFDEKGFPAVWLQTVNQKKKKPL